MEYIETGEIVSVHGIKGDIKIYPWADSINFLEEFNEFYIQKNGNSYQKLTAQEVRAHKNIVIVKFEDINSVETARTLIGKTVYVDKSKILLPEGKYFVADLLGSILIDDATDKEIGTVEAIENFGASDVYTIKTTNEKTYMFPAVKEFIISTDIKAKKIRIKVIEGMFSED